MPPESPRTLNELFLHTVDGCRHDRLLSFRTETGSDVHYSSAAFASGVFAFREFLLRLGLKQGSRVAIYSENRPEWHIADFGTLLAGMIVVPVYPTLSRSQVKHLLTHSEAAAVVFCGYTQREILEGIRGELPRATTFIGIDHAVSGGFILARILAVKRSDRDEARRSALSIAPQTIASIVYTSGTTGAPKGVLLTHDNFCFDLAQCVDRLGFRSARQALSVLPLAHVFERLLCYGYFRMCVPIAYGDPHRLKDLLALYRPEVMGCVPRILEKIRETVEERLRMLPVWKRDLAHTLLNASAGCQLRPQSSVGAMRRLQLALADLFVHRKIRTQLGDVRYLVCGGARLHPEVEAFFRACGFQVLQGYGLTETSPVICLNGFGREGLGTVGRPLSGVEVRLGEDGEILTRGRHVMQGYYKDAGATAAAFSAGWFRTGDTGAIDSAGRVRVTGRKSDGIVLSTGKKVSAAAVEAKLESCELIRSAFVVGTGRKFVAAVIIADVSRLAAVASEADLLKPEVAALYAQAIEDCCADLAGFEQVKRFCFLTERTLADCDLVTPTLKLRRSLFEQKFASELERLYREEAPFVIDVHSRNVQTAIP
jgi:long-chain acyl-CoA synthetase